MAATGLKDASRIGGDVRSRRPRSWALVAAVALLVTLVGTGGIFWLQRRKVQVRMLRQWKWDHSEYWDMFHEAKGIKVGAPCVWLDAGPFRIRWPTLVVDGERMAAQTESMNTKAIAHLQRFDLDEADRCLEEVRQQPFLVVSPDSTLTDYSQLSCYVLVAKGHFRKATQQAYFLGFYDRKVRTRAEPWELTARATKASEERLVEITRTRGADEGFTLAALYLNRGQIAKGRQLLIRAAQKDPGTEAPKVGGIARLWLKKLNADAAASHR
jgi:hypothetical protein